MKGEDTCTLVAQHIHPMYKVVISAVRQQNFRPPRVCGSCVALYYIPRNVKTLLVVGDCSAAVYSYIVSALRVGDPVPDQGCRPSKLDYVPASLCLFMFCLL